MSGSKFWKRRIQAQRNMTTPHYQHPPLRYTYYDQLSENLPSASLGAGMECAREMTLAQFGSVYQDNLPQQVLVTKGVYSANDDEFTISNSEKLNIYYVRHRDSVGRTS